MYRKNLLIIVGLLFSISSLATASERIKVDYSDEIKKTYTKKVLDYEECYDEEYMVKVSCGNEPDKNSLGIDTLLGTVVGVAIGHQVGGGSGKDVAKVIGGLSGGYIANQQRGDPGICKEQRTRKKCQNVYKTERFEKIIGYNNCATVYDKKVCKKSKRPLRHLKITHSIRVH